MFQVYCRIRPLEAKEKCVKMLDETTVQVANADVSGFGCKESMVGLSGLHIAVMPSCRESSISRVA